MMSNFQYLLMNWNSNKQIVFHWLCFIEVYFLFVCVKLYSLDLEFCVDLKKHHIINRQIGDLPIRFDRALIGHHKCFLDMVILVFHKAI